MSSYDEIMEESIEMIGCYKQQIPYSKKQDARTTCHGFLFNAFLLFIENKALLSGLNYCKNDKYCGYCVSHIFIVEVLKRLGKKANVDYKWSTGCMFYHEHHEFLEMRKMVTSFFEKLIEENYDFELFLERLLNKANFYYLNPRFKTKSYYFITYADPIDEHTSHRTSVPKIDDRIFNQFEEEEKGSDDDWKNEEEEREKEENEREEEEEEEED